MTFAEKLQKLRKQNGLSQEQLAEKLNVSRQAVSKWEMGTIPDMENMVKLGRYFDCSLDYLMNDDIDTNAKSHQSPKIENKNLAWKCVATGLIITGLILSLLMPLFAKMYQGFEFSNFHQCFTDSWRYIFKFPLLGILLIALGTAGSTKAKLVAEADTNVVLTRQNCLVNTVGNSSVTIYNKMVGATVAVAVSIE